MRKSLLAAAVGVAALASSQPPRPKRRRSAARQRAFRDLVQRGGAAPLRPRHALPALVLVPRREGDLRGGAEGRSDLRHGPLGRRADASEQPAQRRFPRPNLAPGLAAIQKAKAIGAKTERERDYIDALMLMYADYDKLSHAQRIRAFRDADGEARGEISRTTTRRRSPTPSRSTPRLARPTRPTPSRPRAPRSWSRSRSGCRSIRASRTT